MGNYKTNLFRCANNPEKKSLYKYITWPNLILSWNGEQESVCCSVETSIYSGVHQSAVPAQAPLDHPPTQCWNTLAERSLKPFPRLVQIRLVKAVKCRSKTPLVSVQLDSQPRPRLALDSQAHMYHASFSHVSLLYSCVCATCPRAFPSYHSKRVLGNPAEMLQMKTAGRLYAERDEFCHHSHSVKLLAFKKKNVPRYHRHLCSRFSSYRNCVAWLLVVIELKSSVAFWPNFVYLGLHSKYSICSFFFFRGLGSWKVVHNVHV